MALALAWTLVAPAAAFADGPRNPIATSYLARVDHTPSGVQARVLDGYLELWLQVPARQTLEVLDQVGAPWLRFNVHGVAENHNSLLFYLSRQPTEAVPPARITARTPPDWVQVSSGHSWSWRDGRIQAFAHQSLTPGTRLAGPWSIPVRVNGRTAAVAGRLYYQPPPSAAWFWPIVVIILCVLAGWRLRSPRLDRRLTLALTQALLGALGVVAVARLLHGRPSVSAVQIIEMVLAAGGIVSAAVSCARGRLPAALPFIVAFVALWAGLTFLPVLSHGEAILILPAWISRAATVVLLGGGVGLVFLAMRRPLLTR